MKKNLSFPGQESFVVKKKSNKKFSQFTGGIMPSASDTADGSDGTVLNPPTLPNIPIFPDFSIMSCVQLMSALEDLNATLYAPSLVANDKEWVKAYESAIAYVQSLLISKGCQTKHAPVIHDTGGGATPTIKTTTTSGGSGSTSIPGASGGMGLMGGGAPAPSTTAQAKKSKFPWLWVIIGGAVLVYIMSGKKA